MCGIAGVWGGEGREAVERMVHAMRHRGPDDEGIHAASPIVLGATRLSIVDLSAAGHQPMASEDGAIRIAYNGETYNFLEERRRLEKLGHRFRSGTDTEVVLNLYLERGAGCVERMRGMFAFAIWDSRTQTLLAARDRLGIKPFYYAAAPGRLVFGSELKALLASGLVDGALDPPAVCQLLALGSIQPPRTILTGVSALLPGHLLTFDGGRLDIRPYWDLPATAVEGGALRFDEATMELRSRLLDAVRLELVSDVPLGVFLGGGVDSATVLAMMAETGVRTIKTFSISFEETEEAHDESRHAAETARHFGADHRTLAVTGKDVDRAFEHFVWSLDQPSVDGLNTYLVAGLARQEITVALSGLGGDELFAGYGRMMRIYWERRRRGMFLRDALSSAARSGAGKAALGVLPPALRTRLEARALRGDPFSSYLMARQVFPIHEIARLIQPAWTSQACLDGAGPDDLATFDDPTLADPVARMSRLDLKTFMPFQLLRDMDAVSMAHSLEVRFPLIDHELVEFVFALPTTFKYEARRRPVTEREGEMTYEQSGAKRILFAAMNSLLPPGISRRPKEGFKLPIDRWLQSHLRDRVEAAVRECVATGLFAGNRLTRLWGDFACGRTSWMQVWVILVLGTWVRAVLGGRGDPA